MGKQRQKKTAGSARSRASGSGFRQRDVGPVPGAQTTSRGEAGQGASPPAPAAFARPGGAVRVTARQRGTAAPAPIARSGVDLRAAMFALPVDERQSLARSCAPAALEEMGMEAVAPTYSFKAPDTGGVYDLAVRFVGLRRDVTGSPTSRDHFERVERVKNLPANGEPVALTARIQHMNGGDWRVVAEPLDGTTLGARFPRRVIDTRTQFVQLAHGPHVRPWSWPILVALGAGLAVTVQAWLASRIGIAVLGVLALSLVGCVFGFLGGKFWFLGLHRKPLSQFLNAGACIQGFLLVSLAVLSAGALVLGLGVGDVLDVTIPGIFLGVAVGRPGCFLTGCCAGRPTASRWGILSSDRRIALRRVPVQLLEALTGLVIGAVGLVVTLLELRPVPGALFVASLAAYTLVRQLLFPLRVESRTSRGRMWTMGLSGIVLLAASLSYLG